MERTDLNYAGYLNLGGSDKEDAKNKIGIQLIFKKKPNAFRRFMLWLCFNVYWIDGRK